MTSYADLASLQSWMSAGDDSAVTFTGDDEAALQLLLDAATTWIDQYTGRSFAAEAAATKYFYATSPTSLALPDIRTITSLAYDANGTGTFATVLTEGTDFYKTPLNPRPDPTIYTGVQIYPYSSRGFYGAYRVRVIGDWGYVVNGAAPPNVQQACLLLARRWWERRNAPLGIVQNTDIGTFRSLQKADPDVESLLVPYRAASVGQNWLVV